MKIVLITLFLLISNTCFAQTFDEFLATENQLAEQFHKIINNSKPKIATPKSKEIRSINVLDCGVTIEKSGGLGKLYGELNKLCSDVVEQYRTNFPQYDIPAKVNVPVSFLPRKVLVESFGKMVKGASFVKLDGFTEINHSGRPLHFYVLSDWSSKFYFKTVFAHELFHVLNAFAGYDDSEQDAEKFTTGMGLGI